MRVEQHVRTMRLGHLAIGDRVDQRPAVGLTSKVSTRHVAVTGVPAAASSPTSG